MNCQIQLSWKVCPCHLSPGNHLLITTMLPATAATKFEWEAGQSEIQPCADNSKIYSKECAAYLVHSRMDVCRRNSPIDSSFSSEINPKGAVNRRKTHEKRQLWRNYVHLELQNELKLAHQKSCNQERKVQNY